MKIFSILLIIVSTFLLNIGLYYTSKNYRLFLRNIKQENIVDEINDNYKVDTSEFLDKGKNNLENNTETLESELNKGIINEKDGLIKKIKIEKKDDSKIILNNYSKSFLEKFKQFNLVELKSHSNLMDVTSEYPDDYFEYYNKDLTLYFFPTKNYNEIKEIFEIESDGDFFKINEVNNFGEESFYINLGKRFDDGFIRIIFSKNNNVIGIKISKDKYNKIKNIIK